MEKEIRDKLNCPQTPRTKDLNGELKDWYEYAVRIESQLQSLQEKNDRLLKAIDSWKDEEDLWNERELEYKSRIKELREKAESRVYSDVWSAWCSLDNDEFDTWLHKRI